VIARYRAQLAEHLSALPVADPQEILTDIRSHLAEASADGGALETSLAALGPADALARSYSVELMLNPRRLVSPVTAYRLKVAALIVAGSVPALFTALLLGGVGAVLVLGGLLAGFAGIVDAFGTLPGWISTAGLPPVVVVSIGAGWTLLGLARIFALRRFFDSSAQRGRRSSRSTRSRPRSVSGHR
jgi:uncharacterized membrane protein